MKPRRIPFTTVLAALLVAACASHQSDEPGPAPVPAAATLKVDNQRFLDMTIYVIEGSLRQRLGIAAGNSTTSFTIPSRLTRGPTLVRFLADPIGGRALPVTEDITVEPGDEVTMRIPPG